MLWDATNGRRRALGRAMLQAERRRTVTYEEAQAWFKENGGERLSSRGVTTVTVLGRSVRFSAKLPEETEFLKAVARLKRILA